jgi:catechol 2,3-dioxygenase-like lactoylglutathione lyase family enzyme
MSSRHLAMVAILVPDYEAGLDFFVGKLGFELLEDTDLGDGKRWVRVAPAGAQTQFLLARAVGDQRRAIGNQGGGRVWLFLSTDDFDSDHDAMIGAGVEFEEQPRLEPYGKVAVFHDPFGNRWDLIEYATEASRESSEAGGFPLAPVGHRQ